MRFSRRTGVIVTIGLAAAIALPVASAATGHQDPAAPPAFPTFVHLPADQAAHPSTQNEWWYTAGQLTAGGHRYGYEVQIVRAPVIQSELAITDITAGRYYTQTTNYTADQATFSTTDLNASVPTASLSGPLNAMTLHATLPTGSLNLTLDATGPALYPSGTGLMPFLGGSSYYYSLPAVATTGTLTLNGATSTVTGESWIDRQWGNWDWSTLDKWTWMDLQLSNGARLNLWDIFSSGTESHYATVLCPDGTETIAEVDPLAPTTSNFVTSPTTSQRYGTRWVVHIPAEHATLTVDAGPLNQEIQTNGGIFEGASSVAGTYQGEQVTGHTYVEQFGNWS